MDKQEDIMSIIHLLAGAAQSGAQGVLAQAAFNLVTANEAVQKAEQIERDDMKQRANALLNETRDVFLRLANDAEALEEGKADIIMYTQHDTSE